MNKRQKKKFLKQLNLDETLNNPLHKLVDFHFKWYLYKQKKFDEFLKNYFEKHPYIPDPNAEYQWYLKGDDRKIE